MNKNILGTYENGNCKVTILKDGTKIRRTEDDEFLPEKPESMDLKLTNYCDGGCKFCHEKSSTLGAHADYRKLKFLDTLHPYTEIAAGGGDLFSYPDLVPFLEKCKERKIICNATFNQIHLARPENLKLLKKLKKEKLLYGVGVSLIPTVESAQKLLKLIKGIPNVVVHVINGIHSTDVLKELYDQNITLLVLGYKTFGRGKDYYEKTGGRIEEIKGDLKDELRHLIPHFKAVSFDNLAIEQLDIKSLMSPEQWNEFYMGDEGSFTMYVDAVKCEYGESSISTERFPLEDDIVPMFSNIRQLTGHKVYKKGE